MSGRAAARFAVAALAGAMAGCGSADPSPTQVAPGPGGAQAAASAPVAAAARAPALRSRHRARHPAVAQAPPKAPRSVPAKVRTPSEQGAPSVAAGRRNDSARLAGAVLAQFGLPVASIAVSKHADAVTIAVPVKPACTATADDQSHILLVLHRLLPAAKRIRVIVAPGTTALRTFVASRCPEVALPTGPGPVIFDRTGAGSIHRVPVTIAAKRWAIAYDSRAAYVHMVVRTRAGRAIGRVVMDGRGVGQRWLRGPGRFVISISSPATWRLVVRDGL